MDEVVVAGFRTSPCQADLWRLLDSAGSAGSAPWHQLTVLIDGPVDRARLDEAVRTARSRHETLRTRLRAIPGQTAPVQVIDPETSGLAAVYDLAGGSDWSADLNRLAVQEQSRLHPSDGPTARIVLARSDGGRAALIITTHPLVADRSSVRLLLAEIAAGYDGAPLPPVQIQYADYAAWHHNLLGDEERAPRRAYWDAHIDPVLPRRVNALLDEAVGAQPGQWRTVRRHLAGTASGALADLAADLAGGESSVVATAWALLLWRLSGERDIGLTETVPGRPFAELAGAVGPFARDVPVAVRFTADLSFREAVAAVDTALRDAADHADDLDPDRLRSGAVPPGFEYVPEHPPVGAADLVFRPVREQSRGVSPLVLRAGRDRTGRWVELGHDVRRIEPGRADDLLERLLVVVDRCTGTPTAAIGTVGMLIPGERGRLLAKAQGPAHRSTAGQTLHELVAEQARRTPGAVALDDGRIRLTYAELQRLADRFAQRLTTNGAGPGDRIVLFMERSAEFVVALLAVLKTGAAYVPLDVRQPARRLAFVLADVGSPVLVTAAAGAVPPDVTVPVVRCEVETLGPVDAGGDVVVRPAMGGDLAYVMYTSGSTGAPNGVPVTHEAMLNYLFWAVDAYDLRSGSGSLVHSSVGFDLTVTGLLGPLLVGQRVVLVPESSGLAGLVAALRDAADVTLLKVTPSQLGALTQLMAPTELADRVRTLVVGGEQLRAEALTALRSASPALRIVNEYGPTETAVGSCAYEVDERMAHSGPVPIGTPIAGSRIYLLDDALQPVPDGAPGEIYIGGVGVSCGYHDRPELSAERFGPDPFVPAGRWFRTGDRGRRLRSGNLVYLGRIDDQLKIHGVRVEPGEIESVLREHPSVADAAVVAEEVASRGAAERATRLIAHIVPAGAEAPAAELDRFCRTRLPDYLIPVVFAATAALPTTPNGKLDRAGLARLPRIVDTADEYAPPHTETEEVLSAVLAAVLGRDRVGIDDNYFAIGGDSIRSVVVASRARARGVAITVADLHRYPTVRELAAALGDERPGTPERDIEPFALISAEDRALMPPDVEDAFPLNLLQEGMIFHRDFAAKSAVYHAIASVRLRAPLDVEAMRQVVHQLVQRHPMLRTSFDQTTFSRPLQLVHRTFRDPLWYEDLRGLDPDDQHARIEGWVEREKQRGFELHDHPLIRFMLQPLDDETFQFSYGFHHEIVDGWSEALMVTQLFGHYFSIVFNEPITIEAPRSSMRDAVALELEALQRQEDYDFWSCYLADATLMRLPRLDSGLAADTGAREIERIAVPVSAILSDRLKQLAAANAVPLKSVLLAAHMAVMHQYHGQEDTLSYTVTNGRPETADGSTAIGLFVNSLAMRLKLSGGTWNQLIQATLDSERRSMPHRRLPMAELKRHQGNEPLAETLFFFTDYHVFRELDRWRARGVEHVASELYGESTFPFCAIFRLNRDTARLEVRIEYDTLQFSAKLMDEIAACYVRVLEAMTTDPDGRYDTASLLSEDEHRRLMRQWNDSGPPLGDGALVHDLIGRQARVTPDAVAVEYGEAAVTYATLERWADRVAAALRTRGAGPETTVALLAHHGIETFVCLLGVLKAGAAYLPLDPSQPDERLAMIVDRAAPVLVLAEREHAHRVGEVPLIVIEPGLPFTGETRPWVPAAPATAQHPAYVLSTSGSTGEPKGVVVTHGGLVNSTLARTRVYPHRPERFLLLSSLGFDSSVAGLFWPLCTGGTLVLPHEGIQLEPAAIAVHVQQRQITHTLCVPSLLTAVLDLDEPAPMRSLRAVIVAGEASPRELYEDHRRSLPDCAFYNEYGPTENTVWSTVWSGEPVAYRSQLPIGRPVPGVRAYLLNPHLQPVPVGVAGEVYLAGAGLARGYLRRPGLTAKTFLPDPFAVEPGARMYRSGDVARHTGEGALEFLGRADDQVKIRGFRVEPGEIEGVLDAHPDVRRSVVLARADTAGEKALVAYVATRPGVTIDGGTLQRYVRDRLPKYMVPADVVVLDTLPLTATGKVDRRSLPVPDRARRRHVPFVAPRTDTEQVLAAIWSQALGRTDVGVHDDFFELGGESLRAMQVVTKTNKVFGLDLSVRTLFDATTVAALGEAVDEARTAGVS